jgi:hypothetical protein
MADIQVTMTAAMERALGGAVREVSLVLVGELAKQHGFEADAAIATLGLDRFVTKRPVKGGQKAQKAPKEPKEKVKKSRFPLPWCGIRNKCNCTGIRLNHGLHTQCTQKPVKGMKYCKTCQQQADRSATGKPTYGDVEDREAVGILEYVDPKGKQTLPFANVMQKLNISREDVEAEAKEFAELLGTDTIPEEHFTIREAKRGRPKKESTGDEKPKEKKKRGRPAKAQKVVQSGVGNDLIAELVNGVDAESDAESVASSSSTGSRGRPRLSDEEKQRRAQEKAQAKAEREAAKEQVKQQKAQEKAQAKAAKRQSLIDEITALNSEVSTAMDLSTMPEDVAELKTMLSDLKKQKKADEKAAAAAAAKAAKAAKEAEQLKAKQEREAAAAAKRAPVLDEYMSLASEAGVTVTEAPEKIGDLRKGIAEFKRTIRETKKAAKTQEKEAAPSQEPLPTQTATVEELTVEPEEDDDDGVDAEQFEHDGKSYLRTTEGVVYDSTTHEPVGVWNDETDSIDELPEDSDDEDEDESE